MKTNSVPVVNRIVWSLVVNKFKAGSFLFLSNVTGIVVLTVGSLILTSRYGCNPQVTLYYNNG